MKYLDNLVAWADQLFRRYSIESLNEATQLYLLASKILGPRPNAIAPRANVEGKTYLELADGLDAFSNALVDVESYVPPRPSGVIGLPAWSTAQALAQSWEPITTEETPSLTTLELLRLVLAASTHTLPPRHLPGNSCSK